MATISNFKQNFQGGVRPNQFRVNITAPFFGGTDLEFLGKGASIPSSVIGNIDVPYRGRQLKVPGDRTFEDWSVTIINDSEFSARSALEAWQQDIQELDSGVGMASNDYLLSRAFVEQLGKDDAVLARYEFFNMFPKNIAAIDLNYETVDALEEFTVDFTYSHWERVV